MSSASQRLRQRFRSVNTTKLLTQSGLFDGKSYLARYADVAEAGMDPLTHFVRHGASEGRWPHPLFHTDWYCRTYPDVASSGINPLLHFALYGRQEQRDPNSLFSTKWYLAENASCANESINPLLHYCLNSSTVSPSPNFDSPWYFGRYSDVTSSGLTPLDHFFRYERSRGTFPNHRAERLHQDAIQEIKAAHLFDPTFYLNRYDDLRQGGVNADDHFLKHGYREGRAPHPLFDPTWYFDQNPDQEAHDNPVLHYLRSGADAGLDPNAWFDTDWYLQTYPDCRASGLNPLTHFLLHGGWRTSPSPMFDAVWYFRRYPDVASSGANPLVHYLSCGREEGRAIRSLPDSRLTTPEEACLVGLKRGAAIGPRAAVFITHAPSGTLRGYVERYVRAFVDQSIEVILIVAADQRRTSIPQALFEICHSVFVRENKGFDFAAWAHILKITPQLFRSESLFLINDSLVGPINLKKFATLIDRIEKIDADIVGLTSNSDRGWHLQSFFLVLRSRALSNYWFQAYLLDIINLPDKALVIERYELSFTARMKAVGLTCQAVFPETNLNVRTDRTIFQPIALLDQGFPFVKASLLNGPHRDKGGASLIAEIQTRGFDTDLLDAHCTRYQPKVWADLQQSAPPTPSSTKVSFIGPWNYANGLGVASRGYVAALMHTDFRYNILPIEKPFHVHARVAPDWNVRSFKGPADVALIHLNGEAWNTLLNKDQREVIDRATIRIGVFVWELSTIPDRWLRAMSCLDAVWVPTEFCAAIFRNWTDLPVQVVPYVVPLPPIATMAPDLSASLRRKYNLRRGANIILYAFDGSSFLARKNPHALVRAFCASGLEREGWQLVLKTKHMFDLPTEGEGLMKLIGGRPSIRVINQPLPSEELGCLFAMADIYASSHSSEGFGLTIAEAMAMGKVVVATDYAGSHDFLDETCGFPVRAEVNILKEDLGPYAKGGAWAIVDEDALAKSLREAATAVKRGSQIGRNARERIGKQLSIPKVAKCMRDSISELLHRQEVGSC